MLSERVFCCACMVYLSFGKRSEEVWVGGLPDVLVYRNDSHAIENLPSRHLPLGVVDNDRFKTETTVTPLNQGDRIYLWSDGIIEATNDQGEMFGEQRVYDVIASTADTEQIFSAIEAAVEKHAGRGEQDDDYTMVEVSMVNEELLGEYFAERGVSFLAGGPKDWSMTYELRPQTLREFNPLPLITHLLMEVPGLRPHSG